MYYQMWCIARSLTACLQKYQIPRDRLVREIIMRGEESESSKEMVVAYRLLYDAGGYSMRDSTAADEASLISRSLAELSMSPPVALTDVSVTDRTTLPRTRRLMTSLACRLRGPQTQH